MKRINSVEDLEREREKIRAARDPNKPCITICTGTGCHAAGCYPVAGALREALRTGGIEGEVDLRITGCHGFCERGPLVVINPQRILYQRVKPDDAPDIVSETLKKGKIIERLLYVHPLTEEKIVREDDVPFYKLQKRIIFGNNGNIDPTSIEDYLAIGGYSALAKALTSMEPQQIVEEVKKSGLRGRGGGGFHTGTKWESCRKASGDTRYVICNADEGDPGAYMDRSLLEGNPHSVLEGMIIGAFAIGSNEGYVYVRNEYPLAVENLRIALDRANDWGFFGKNILGSGFDFNVKINRGGGAFVCGESTALMASLEGQPGEPRAKHIHTVESGLYEKPTNLNNVETWANVPYIVNLGAEQYRQIGTDGSKGTKIFSLVGKVNNTGLVEVPMGITLREIVYDIGGGIIGGKRFKAIQTGGPSGGCLPESLLDLPVDFDRLTEAGSMMGSGGMIVMDENNCMVDVAKYFMNFLKEESCGKCASCREGTKRMYEVLHRITEGNGREGDIALLEDLSFVTAEASLCALGGTAPNPVLSTIRYFREEYEVHIKNKKCPAGVCKELITYRIIPNQCTICGRCQKVCPSQAIRGKIKMKKPFEILPEKCIRCGMCSEACKFDAIEIV
ncbi:MAG: 4Fe-4S dicluster domain-containing protein [Proteobacteria bacterium]|nr:4Fe-4S dicluster domain-containing protein [Pseudomonadota bacterium]NIS70878.1 4Fe-4S dicluster domain-containing protein [Pseudomonadota bacterium]